MKPLSVILALVVGILGLNLLTWAGWGRDQVLLLAPLFYDNSCPPPAVDTLQLFSGPYPRPEPSGWSTVKDFRPRTVASLADSLRQRQRTHGLGGQESYVVVVDAAMPDLLEDGQGIGFGVEINRRHPLFAELAVISTVPYAFAYYGQSWIWVFGWRPVGEMESGCT